MKRPLITVPVLVFALVLSLGLAGPAAAQSATSDLLLEVAAQGATQERREAFVAALRQFTNALEGTFCEEKSRIRSSIESMHRALVQWDEVLRYETALASERRDPKMHVALGTAYLDRSRVEDALRQFTAASQIDPREADVYTLQGLAWSLANRPAEAKQALLKATALDPGNLTALYALAHHLMKIGQREEAMKALQDFQESQRKRLAAQRANRAVASRSRSPFKWIEPPAELLQQAAAAGPIFPPARYAPGFTLLKQGKYEQAIVRLREAAALDPRATNAVAKTDEMVQGCAAWREGKLQSALNHFRVASEVAPNHAEGRWLLGTVYWAAEQYSNSIEQFTAAVRLSPRDERSRMALTGVLVAAGQLTEAEQALKEAIRAIPGSGQAHYDLGRLYHTLSRHSEALHEFEEALKFNPLSGQAQLYHVIGIIYWRQTNFDGAIEAFAKRIEAAPNDAHAHRELAELYSQRGRHDEALAEFVAALVINPQSSEAYAGIGQIRHRTGRYADAAEASQRALELDRANSRARYTLATSLIRLGETEAGKKELQEFERMQTEALASEHREWELKAIKLEASASLENGEYDKAVALLRKAVPYEPNVASPYLSLGRALLKAGQPEEAIEKLKKALALNAGPDAHWHLVEAYRAVGRLEESEREKAIYERLRDERLRRISQRP